MILEMDKFIKTYHSSGIKQMKKQKRKLDEDLDKIANEAIGSDRLHKVALGRQERFRIGGAVLTEKVLE